MSLFRNLRDVCITFEEDLRKVSSELFTARIDQPFEDEISNKMRDLSLFTAKLRFLEAKSISMTPQSFQDLSEDAILAGYEDSVTWKVIEQQTVKAVTQSRDVRALIATPDSKLDPEMIYRKSSIISKLKEYRVKEERLSEMDATLKRADTEHHQLRIEWDRGLGELRDLRGQAEAAEEEMGLEGPLFNKLRVLIDKMEIMRWLISRLVTARSAGYDWLSDPHRRLGALKMAREPNSVEFYMGM